MKNPDISEKVLLSAIKKYLLILKRYGLLTFTRIHVMPVMRGDKSRIKFSANNDMVGFSDLEVLSHGKIAYIEVKTGRGTLSNNQKDFLIDRAHQGAQCAVVRSLNDVMHFLDGGLKVAGLNSVTINRACRHGSVRRISYGQGSLWIYKNTQVEWERPQRDKRDKPSADEPEDL